MKNQMRHFQVDPHCLYLVHKKLVVVVEVGCCLVVREGEGVHHMVVPVATEPVLQMVVLPVLNLVEQVVVAVVQAVEQAEEEEEVVVERVEAVWVAVVVEAVWALVVVETVEAALVAVAVVVVAELS